MGSSRRRVTIAAVGLFAWAAAGAAAQQAAPAIAPQDNVTVMVVGTEIPSGPFVVDAEGTIDFPYLGHVKAAGLTARELGAAISKALVAAQVLVGEPQVTVTLQQTESKTVTVSGAVNKKGEFAFAGELTVFNALIKAGGAAPDAGDEVLLIRAPRQEADGANAATAQDDADEDVITLSRREIERGDFGTTVLVEDGDRIVVSKARQVYIDGYVNRPGGYTIEPGATLRQVLSLAGGATELGALNRVRVLRDGKPLDDVDLDKTIIQPGDTITVPKRFL